MKKLTLLAPLATIALLSAFGNGAKPIEARAEDISAEMSEIGSSYVESGETVSKPASESVPEPLPEVSAEPTPEPTSESDGKVDWSKVVVDGKPVSQWMEELQNKETRRTAIVALAVFALTGSLFVIKWLSDRGLIKRNGKVAEDSANAIAQMKIAFADQKENLLREKEQAAARIQEYKEQALAYKAQMEEQAAAFQKKYEEQAMAFKSQMEEQALAYKDEFVRQSSAYREALDEQKANVSEQIAKTADLFGKDSIERERMRQAIVEMAKTNPDYVRSGTFKKIRDIFGGKADGEEE